MDVSEELLFFFSALGAFNGLLLGCYFLLFARPRSSTTRFLGMLVLMLSIRVGKSVFFYFNPDLALLYLQLGLTACFFIGPFLYCYTASVLSPDDKLYKTWPVQLIVLAAIAIIGGIAYPFETHHDLWHPYIWQGIYITWYAYILATAFVLRKQIKKVFKKGERCNSMEIWLLTLMVGNILLATIYVVLDITFYIAGALSFSFLMYLSVLFVFFNRKNKNILFYGTPKYGDKKIDPQEATQLTRKLNELIVEEQLFKNADLKIAEVAERLQMQSHKLSQLINEHLGKSFTVLVNEHRIHAAQELIRFERNMKLEAVGYDCGFNSVSTFYAAFRKVTGTTPAKYKSGLS